MEKDGNKKEQSNDYSKILKQNTKSYGVIFYAHDRDNSKVPLATMSLEPNELKRATLIDEKYSRILTGIAKECGLSQKIYVWIDGTEFKIKKPEELNLERLKNIINDSKNDIAR